MSLGDDPRLLALQTIACSVGPGAGGLGRHLDELIHFAESGRIPDFRYISPAGRHPGDSAHVPSGRSIRGGRFLPLVPTVQAYPLFIHAAAVAFDYAASRKLAVGDLGFTGFACHSLLSLRRAKRLGIAHVGLVAPNSHVNNLWRQQNLAQVLYPIDKGWLTNSLRRRTIREYDLADVIFISSEYQKSTFREFGVPDEKLIRIDLTPHPRFRRRASLPATTTFNIAYVGRFDLIKGLPLLIDAFAKAARSDWRLRLMGQFSSYRLRKYVASKIREDSRITLLEYGDPLSVLESAHVYVHPSFEDGFGYAPMEALAVGVPVIVTDQTGMSEYVREGIDGSVIPAGHLEPLVEALKHFSSQ